MGIVIISLIILACIALPFIYVSINSYKQKQIIVSHLQTLAKQDMNEVSQYDTSINLGIGCNATQNKFYFIDLRDGYKSSAVNLDLMASCQLVKKYKTLIFEKKETKVLERLSVDFHSKGNEQLDVEWLLFELDKHLQVTDELELGEKWTKLIKAKMI